MNLIQFLPIALIQVFSMTLSPISTSSLVTNAIVGIFWSLSLENGEITTFNRNFRSKLKLVLFKNISKTWFIFAKNFYKFSILAIIGIFLQRQVFLWIKTIFASLITIYVMQIINSDFSELKFNSPKEDLRKFSCQKMDAKVLYTLNNLPKSHIRELFVEKDPDPTLWTVFSEIYVNRIKDFIQGTSGQTVKVIDKKESGFAPGRAVSGETMRSRTNNTLKSKWTKFWELIYEEDKKTENLDQGQQDSSFSLPDLLKSRKTQELKDLEKKAKIKKLSYFSFESIFNSWITSPKKEFDAVLWISKDFESHVWTFSSIFIQV